jgi:hypothetical protein
MKTIKKKIFFFTFIQIEIQLKHTNPATNIKQKGVTKSNQTQKGKFLSSSNTNS